MDLRTIIQAHVRTNEKHQNIFTTKNVMLKFYLQTRLLFFQSQYVARPLLLRLDMSMGKLI